MPILTVQSDSKRIRTTDYIYIWFSFKLNEKIQITLDEKKKNVLKLMLYMFPIVQNNRFDLLFGLLKIYRQHFISEDFVKVRGEYNFLIFKSPRKTFNLFYFNFS